jgi:DNA transformation protein
MAASPEFITFLCDQLTPLGPLGSERFFGGTALRARGALFAMVMRGKLYFAVNDATRPSYEQMGSQSFWYDTKNGRVQVKRFYEVPEALLDEREQLLALATQAVDAALSLPQAKRRGSVTAKPRKKA